jgi:hypothetical protein
VIYKLEIARSEPEVDEIVAKPRQRISAVSGRAAAMDESEFRATVTSRPMP